MWSPQFLVMAEYMHEACAKIKVYNSRRVRDRIREIAMGIISIWPQHEHFIIFRVIYDHWGHMNMSEFVWKGQGQFYELR